MIRFVFCVLILSFSSSLLAGQVLLKDREIIKLRAVGDYIGTTYDSSLEVWFASPIVWPAGISCTNNQRVYIDAQHKHLISAALLAFSGNLKVNANVDDSLKNRNGSCEISFIDLVK